MPCNWAYDVVCHGDIRTLGGYEIREARFLIAGLSHRSDRYRATPEAAPALPTERRGHRFGQTALPEAAA